MEKTEKFIGKQIQIKIIYLFNFSTFDGFQFIS